jgi:hypothetical protein
MTSQSEGQSEGDLIRTASIGTYLPAQVYNGNRYTSECLSATMALQMFSTWYYGTIRAAVVYDRTGITSNTRASNTVPQSLTPSL